ncbi:MAG: YdcF family protein [Verrucomicrobia bacterium]|nr:YdcF family protein [Verrucomicrobiota bacterium]
MAKLLSDCLQPLAALWLGLVLLTLWRWGQRQWRLSLCPALLAALVWGIGATPLPATWLASLERPYAVVDTATGPPADAVVMLGGMTTPSEHDVFGFHFGGDADRVVTAVELVRQRKGRVLVLGGGQSPQTPNPGEGELLRRWVEAWNVPRTPVFLLGVCRDTRDEAERTRTLAELHGWKRILLVTSAAHMRRAEATFRRLGLEVTPWACDFDGLSALAGRRGLYLIPGTSGFDQLDRYVHEVVGYWVYRWRGWL